MLKQVMEMPIFRSAALRAAYAPCVGGALLDLDL